MINLKFLKICILVLFILLPINCNRANANYYQIISSEVSAFNTDPIQIDWTTNAIIYASQLYQIDPLLLTALVEQESGFNLNAYSPMGAIGIAQLMPETASAIGVNPYNPLENIIGGAAYLRMQLNNFSNYGEYNTTYALAAYNAGPGAIYEHNGFPPYSETINYVQSIANIFNRLNSYR